MKSSGKKSLLREIGPARAVAAGSLIAAGLWMAAGWRFGDGWRPVTVFAASKPAPRAAAAFPSAPSAEWAALEKRFRELPPDARHLTGPLFWLHGDESPDRLNAILDKVAEGGNGSFTAESRPHDDWLGPGWYRDLDLCLRAARRHKMKMWIFDEKWWPSGEVAGKVPPQYGSKRLVAEETKVTGPSRFSADGFAGPRFVAVVAGKVAADGIAGSSLIDLAPRIRNGRLEWEAPDGEWAVVKFTWRYTEGRPLVDGASRDAVDWYIKTVYQPHYDRYKSEFGRTIAGFFYDEPETHGDWGSEVLPMLAERKVDWKRALVAAKLRLSGEEQAAARYQYRDALAEAWGRTLYGGLSDWCRARGVKSIGHFLEHGNGYLNPEICAGNMFQLQKYSDMGGIDAVFDQFVMGKRVTRDAPVWQTPKLGSSISHAYGKPDDVTMVEIFGARGQDLTYPEMKWWTDHMQVSGVNFIIPHSFNPRAPRDTDCPPYFYNGGFEPRWPLYRVFADYTSRLSVLLTGGRHACPVMLLYLGNSAHASRAVTPEVMSEALQDALYDCDWIPYDVFERDSRIIGKGSPGGTIALRQERYRILVVPPVETIPYAAMAKVKRFFDAGGTVVAHGFLPSLSATLGRGGAEIGALRDAVWGRDSARRAPGLGACRTNAAGGRSYLLPEKPSPEQLRRVLAEDAGIHPTLEVIEPKSGHALHVLHRVRSGADLFFICNQAPDGPARTYRFRAAAAGIPERWDPMRNEIAAVPFTRRGGAAEVAVRLEPLESVVLVFRPGRRALPPGIEPAAGRTASASRGADVPIIRVPVKVVEPRLPVDDNDASRRLDGCSWVWYPEGNPAASAPPGRRYFRGTLLLTPGREPAEVAFTGAADNHFRLFVNGREAGQGETDDNRGWSHPATIDVTPYLRPGANWIAIEAVNALNQPSPAGLIGRFAGRFRSGEALEGCVDANYRVSREAAGGWTEPGFDDSGWTRAKAVAPYGGGPWGSGGGSLTLSPVKADPYAARFTLPAKRPSARVVLETADPAPEAAARVTVNGRYAGGFIGRPCRLDITKHAKPGANTLRIEPFAPRSVRIRIVPS